MTGNQCGQSSYTKISRRTIKFKEISRISRRVFKFQEISRISRISRSCRHPVGVVVVCNRSRLSYENQYMFNFWCEYRT